MSLRTGRCRSCYFEPVPRSDWYCPDCGIRAPTQGPLAAAVAVVMLLVVLAIIAVAAWALLGTVDRSDESPVEPPVEITPDDP